MAKKKKHPLNLRTSRSIKTLVLNHHQSSTEPNKPTTNWNRTKSQKKKKNMNRPKPNHLHKSSKNNFHILKIPTRESPKRPSLKTKKLTKRSVWGKGLTKRWKNCTLVKSGQPKKLQIKQKKKLKFQTKKFKLPNKLRNSLSKRLNNKLLKDFNNKLSNSSQTSQTYMKASYQSRLFKKVLLSVQDRLNSRLKSVKKLIH
jgi:hypothetical protein